MKLSFAQRSLMLLRFTVCPLVTLAAAAADNPLGQFEGQTDIGAPALAGSAEYNPASQQYTLQGAGTNMWFGRDQFHFAWTRLKGDFLLRTRAAWTSPGADAHRKFGWMVRPNLEADAPYADAAEHGDGLTSLQFRRAKGANTEEVSLPIKGVDVLQFERKGQTFIFSAARYGEAFVSRALTNFDLGDEVYAGLFVCSHRGGVMESATFRDVRLVHPAAEGFTPYRDYLGSTLEILEVHTGRLQRIYSARQPFEAPNWSTDGTALIYNLSGRGEDAGKLVRFELNVQRPVLLNTGPALRSNNDHVLSFDGARLGVSGQERSGSGSAVYTLPSIGGTPKRITPLTPSYLHGWSPDGKWLIYTGARSNKFDIYKISADGNGPEVRLTDAPGLNDGSEFAPDGQTIYFNSSRTGKMQLWRMKPDGTDQEQVTHDDFNDWFPHVSPDGKWLVFLSFGLEVSPTDHPYYKQVYLRLMPVAGGAARTIAYVYGGQGTINVPSWSPDSQRIAFVSNGELAP